MLTVGGFQLTRDYQQELLKMGKAFNQPKTVVHPHCCRDGCCQRTAEVALSKAMSNPEALTQLQSWYNKADAETPQSLPDLGDPAVRRIASPASRGAWLPFFHTCSWLSMLHVTPERI